MHARWIDFLQKFTFVIKHDPSQQNKVVDALSRRASLLATISTKVVGFDYLKDTCAVDEDFGGIWAQGNNKEFVTDLFRIDFYFGVHNYVSLFLLCMTILLHNCMLAD